MDKRLSVVLAVGLALAPAWAWAQSQGAPEAPSEAPAEAPSGKAAEKEKPPGVTGGYSWSKKPRRHYRGKRRKIDPNAPIATYPGFMMLPDGTSQLWVYVNKKVPVQVSKAPGRVTFVLTGAQIAVWNNTHVLATQFFDTPLSRARLRPDKAGAQLVLELRENVTPTHTVIDGPRGTMVLRVSLPRPSHSYVATDQVAPLGVGQSQSDRAAVHSAPRAPSAVKKPGPKP
ncbi:MAG: hypothetical protein KC776_42865 [Myxococcales bacterium]|nr:hypothetical protein [Myxococcales bacterium]MCB9577517.1 hypothetical protein [Polyangiaceae bacterium]